MRYFTATGFPWLPSAPLRIRHRAWVRSPLLPSISLPLCSRTGQGLLISRWWPLSLDTPPVSESHHHLTKLYPFYCSFLWLAVLPCWSGNHSLDIFQDPAQMSNFGETITPSQLVVHCSLCRTMWIFKVAYSSPSFPPAAAGSKD